ncbi:MAG: hypothetical protein ACJ74H_11955 [Thermoanaerobaculia bacterium]
MTEKGGGSAKKSKRQELARKKHEQAIAVQIDREFYDVPNARTPDERPYEHGGFPRFAASFHKLLAHDDDGLLSEQSKACSPDHQHSGVENYRRLLKGLGIDQTASSDFDSEALNCLELCNRNPPTNSPDDPPRPRVFINPRSSKAFSIKGPDITSLRVSKLLYLAEDEPRLLREISLTSDESAAELIEVYGKALLREQTLGAYSGSLVGAIVNALNDFKEHFVWGYDAAGNAITAVTRKVTKENLFRGPTPGDVAGSYLSVFLTFRRPPLFPSGCAADVADLIGAGKFAGVLSQRLVVPHGADRDFVRTRREYACVQNAFVPEIYPKRHFRRLGPIVTGRHLGDYVHVDNVYEEYIRAADILVGNAYPRTPQSPYSPLDPPPADCRENERLPTYRNEADGPTLGPSDIYSLLGGVREVAERAAFTQKWLVARRARPEVMAALVDRARNARKTDAIGLQIRDRLSKFLTSESGVVVKFLKRVAAFNKKRGGEKNFLLPQMYPEGSPAHPAWPSGHATVAGACVTVLKALFDESTPIRDPNAVITPASGKPAGCQPPLDQQGARKPLGLTVGGELDKLASNVALGRDFGGVHYRTDGEHGIRLGEEVAIRYLQDHLREYRETLRRCGNGASEHRGLTLTRRNGQRICITPDEIHNIEPVALRPAALEAVAAAPTVLPYSPM